ncbi:glycosyltransferase family 2 protein [Domibacillus epiphyticus]|uniref:Glycosyl transferase family 2 n=1 Tax=Domibacillus epiphyticus TaxID=1714355 RepID=A0A1V2A6Q1_9BACI|nr:glycosyltransferase family 2 protein [Domibacillus epiphyticus]OMP66646.1 glycosyl transferase family 2 [Domibacillus epiphyticus]
MKSNILIIIPAFNEEQAIIHTVNQLKTFDDYDYIVINDGSTDQTAHILQQHHIPHISLPVNLGIGGAVQTGYRYAQRNGYDYAIQLDADGQHNPDDLYHLVSEMKSRNVDMLIGSRFFEKTNYKGSLSRRFGILYFNYLLRLIARVNITDPTSGYRIVNRRVIEWFAQDYPVDYPEVEVIAKLARKGYTVEETKVEMNARQGGESSITALKSIYYMFKVTFFALIRSYL